MSDSIRLQKILAQAGFGSRRRCEEFISEGRVSVDGEVMRQLGSKADPLTQTVSLDGQVVAGPGPKSKGIERAADKCYYMLNKPRGVLCTNEDPSGRPLAVQLIPEKRRIFCVGRLDKDTEGLLLLTNDGELTNQLTHPKYGVDKSYLARVDGNVSMAQIKRLERGVHLAEGRTQGASVRVRKRNDRSSVIEISISEGMNRQVRRMLARVSLYCRQLKRVSIGALRLGGLQPGEFRKLTAEELRGLVKAIERAKAASEARRIERAKAPQGVPADNDKDDYDDDNDIVNEQKDRNDRAQADWKRRQNEERLKKSAKPASTQNREVVYNDDDEDEGIDDDVEIEEDEIDSELEHELAPVSESADDSDLEALGEESDEDSDEADDEEEDEDDKPFVAVPSSIKPNQTRDRGADVEEEIDEAELAALGELELENASEIESSTGPSSSSKSSGKAKKSGKARKAKADDSDDETEEDEEDSDEADANNPLSASTETRPWRVKTLQQRAAARKDRPERSDRPSRPERDSSERPRAGRSDRSNRPGRPAERLERSDRPRSSDRSSGRPDARSDRPRSSDRSESPRSTAPNPWKDRGDPTNPGAGIKWSERGERRERAKSRRPLSERPYTPKPSSGGDRPEKSYTGRPAGNRPVRSDRPSRPSGDRPDRSSSDRPSRPYGDRPSRPSSDRPSRPYGDRPDRSSGDRPSRPYSDRPARPSSDRPSRPYGDRPDRSSSDRPSRPYGDRPARPSSDRPSRPYGGGGERSGGGRPSYGSGGGGSRGGPSRGGPPRSGGSFKPRPRRED